jgi:mannose-6-phosphate isomerase-like protein (cupin superfamily)
MSNGPLSSPNVKSLDRYAFDPQRVEKPWGHELVWALSEDYAGKLLSVKAGHELSLQFHRQKDESWYLLEGRAELELAGPGEKVTTSEVVVPGAAFRIRPGTVHRIRALEDTVMLEVSTPQLEDVVRLEDQYGRADAKPQH